MCFAAIYVFKSITANRKSRFSAKIIPVIPTVQTISPVTKKNLVAEVLKLKSAEIDEYEEEDDIRTSDCLSDAEIDCDIEESTSRPVSEFTERAKSA